MKSIRLYTLWFTLLFVALNLTNCKQTDITEQAPTLVSSTQIASFTKTQLVQRIAASGIVDAQTSQFLTLLLQRDIQVYRLTYKTKNTDGTDIMASGALIVPVAIGSETFPIVSQQHGTITNEAQAPSNYGDASEAATVASLFASNGYILSCPDYLGYGESKAIQHPYLHRQTEALASLDMLRAAREFVQTNNAKWNNKVFLAGYSQGGHATMSMLKMMEEQFPTEFSISAASCGAGPYNVEGFMQDLVNKDTHGIPEYNGLYVRVLQTYNRIYNLNRPMSYYFKEPYATNVQATGGQSSINVSINKAFTDAFKTTVSSGSDAAFLAAVRDNNVYDWKPKAPLQLYHGTADNQVFYRNSTDAETAMKARGATVDLITIRDKDHGPAIQDFLTGTFQFFASKK
ncbi:alpha/beta hydrolase family protein [Fibrella aquatica]|uniref:alpha/beta hydrolase family protein n=1 Tax=Fibrella aquatica TaxID=3242487 RepID=UPI00352007A6